MATVGPKKSGYYPSGTIIQSGYLSDEKPEIMRKINNGVCKGYALTIIHQALSGNFKQYLKLENQLTRLAETSRLPNIGDALQFALENSKKGMSLKEALDSEAKEYDLSAEERELLFELMPFADSILINQYATLFSELFEKRKEEPILDGEQTMSLFVPDKFSKKFTIKCEKIINGCYFQEDLIDYFKTLSTAVQNNQLSAPFCLDFSSCRATNENKIAGHAIACVFDGESFYFVDANQIPALKLEGENAAAEFAKIMQVGYFNADPIVISTKIYTPRPLKENQDPDDIQKYETTKKTISDFLSDPKMKALHETRNKLLETNDRKNLHRLFFLSIRETKYDQKDFEHIFEIVKNDISKIHADDGIPALSFAVEIKNLYALKKILSETDVDPNELFERPGFGKDCALMIAAEERNDEAVELLLKHGASIEQVKACFKENNTSCDTDPNKSTLEYIDLIAGSLKKGNPRL